MVGVKSSSRFRTRINGLLYLEPEGVSSKDPGWKRLLHPIKGFLEFLFIQGRLYSRFDSLGYMVITFIMCNLSQIREHGYSNNSLNHAYIIGEKITND